MSKSARAPRVWIYMADPATTADLVDLAHRTKVTWGANPFTSKGDIALIYRCAPYSDIAYAFTVVSQPRATRPQDGTDSPYAADLDGKVALTHPITLRELRREASLARWSFVRNQQGVMRRKLDLTAEGAWPIVARMIRRTNPHFDHALVAARTRLHINGPTASTGRSRDVLQVFISYARKDRVAVNRLYTRLRQEGFIDPWFDLRDLSPGVVFEEVIQSAIKRCEAAVIAVSPNIRPDGFIQKEIGLLRARFRDSSNASPCLFPAKLVPCELPPALSSYQTVELYKPGAYDSLVGQLARRARTATSERTRRTRVRAA